MKFESAVDWWFYLVIAIVVFTLCFTFAPQIKAGQISPILACALIFFSLGLPVWLLVGTFYRIDGDLLVVRSGPFSWNIRVSEIQSAKPSRSSISSPALSLNRIELIYGQGKTLLVSPKNSQAFLEAIGHAD